MIRCFKAFYWYELFLHINISQILGIINLLLRILINIRILINKRRQVQIAEICLFDFWNETLVLTVAYLCVLLLILENLFTELVKKQGN